MTIATSAVAINLAQFTSAPLPNAVVVFEPINTLVQGVYVIAPEVVSCTVDSSGAGTINLVPSPPGLAYKVTVRDSFNRVVLTGSCSVPGANCNLADILVTTPPPSVSGRDAPNGYPGLTGYAINLKNAAGLVLSRLVSLATSPRTWSLPDKDGTLIVDADIAHFVPDSRTVNGHPLTADVTVTKADVGLSNADNTSDANKPISTAQAAALALKADKTITVNGHALSANVTVTKADVTLGNADNTSDANKPISTAARAAFDVKLSFFATRADLAAATLTNAETLIRITGYRIADLGDALYMRFTPTLAAAYIATLVPTPSEKQQYRLDYLARRLNGMGVWSLLSGGSTLGNVIAGNATYTRALNAIEIAQRDKAVADYTTQLGADSLPVAACASANGLVYEYADDIISVDALGAWGTSTGTGDGSADGAPDDQPFFQGAFDFGVSRDEPFIIELGVRAGTGYKLADEVVCTAARRTFAFRGQGKNQSFIYPTPFGAAKALFRAENNSAGRTTSVVDPYVGSMSIRRATINKSHPILFFFPRLMNFRPDDLTVSGIGNMVAFVGEVYNADWSNIRCFGTGYQPMFKTVSSTNKLSTTINSNIVNATEAVFDAGDIGKNFYVQQLDTADGASNAMVATITAVNSPTQAVLDRNCYATKVNRNFGYDVIRGDITAGTNVLNVDGAVFDAADVGRFIFIDGASKTGRVLAAKVLDIISPTSVHLDRNAVGTVAGNSVWWSPTVYAGALAMEIAGLSATATPVNDWQLGDFHAEQFSGPVFLVDSGTHLYFNQCKAHGWAYTDRNNFSVSRQFLVTNNMTRVVCSQIELEFGYHGLQSGYFAARGPLTTMMVDQITLNAPCQGAYCFDWPVDNTASTLIIGSMFGSRDFALDAGTVNRRDAVFGNVVQFGEIAGLSTTASKAVTTRRSAAALEFAGARYFEATATGVTQVTPLPASSDGLAAGYLWSDRGTVKVVQSGVDGYLSRMASAPPPAYEQAYRDFYAALNNAGVLGDLDAIWILVAHDTDAASLNMVSTSYRLSVNTGVSFAAGKGFTGNGTSGVIRTGINPNAAGLRFQQDNSHIGCYSFTQATGVNSGCIIGASAASIYPLSSTGGYTGRMNSAFATVTSQSISSGYWLQNRSLSASFERWRDGVQRGTTTAASIAPTDNEFYLLNRYAQSEYSNHRIGLAHVGRALTGTKIAALNTAAVALFSALGS